MYSWQNWETNTITIFPDCPRKICFYSSYQITFATPLPLTTKEISGTQNSFRLLQFLFPAPFLWGKLLFISHQIFKTNISLDGNRRDATVLPRDIWRTYFTMKLKNDFERITGLDCDLCEGALAFVLLVKVTTSLQMSTDTETFTDFFHFLQLLFEICSLVYAELFGWF